MTRYFAPCALFLLVACSEQNIASDAVIDIDEIAQSDDLPGSLPFEFVRPEDGEPLSESEIDSFTDEVISFYRDSKYFDWLLRMSHGMHADTGMPDYLLWWTETHASKNGPLVTMIHDWSEQHGGHNIMKGNSTILSWAVGGYLMTANPRLGQLVEGYCKGISQSMLGMVKDENDPVKHLMARSVITSNHEYTTHDGFKKGVDYSNWFFAYDRWNCSRFMYTDNPWWGEVWVTNTRSKDGIGYVMIAAAGIAYVAARAPDPSIRDACAHTLDLLTDFSRDIAENNFNIRTKDAEGNPFVLDETTMFDPGKGADIASYSFWDSIFPEAECNNMLATNLLAYGEPHGIECAALGGNPDYEWFSILNNSPNGHIMRSFHIAAIRWALIRGFNDLALSRLKGFDERLNRDKNLDLEKVGVGREVWERDMAQNRLQAAASGYPVTGTEARQIQSLFKMAIDNYSVYPNWNLWDDALGNGEHSWRPPSSSSEIEGDPQSWIEVEAMGLLLDYCWSPFRNTAGQPIVDCDRLISEVTDL